MALPTPEALRTHLAALEAGLLERGTAARLLLLAALAREHLLLIGPTGTGKTTLVRRLHQAFAGQERFELRLRASTGAAELFSQGRMQTAGFAELDDVFEAPSAVLNPLLRLADDRVFDDGHGAQPAPLISLIGSANALPSYAAAAAWSDRFLLRVWLQPVGDASFAPLLKVPPAAPALAAAVPLTVAHLQALESAARAVVLGDDAMAALQRWREDLTARGLPASDRRWQRLARLLRVMAASEGRTSVDALDLWLLPHVLARDDDERAALDARFDAAWTRPTPAPPHWFEGAVAAFETQLFTEQSLPPQRPAPSAERTIGVTHETGGLVRLRAARAAEPARHHFGSLHVAARLAQLDEVAAAIDAQREPLQGDLDEVRAALADRFWLPIDRVAGWASAHRAALQTLDQQASRLALCREGFAALPLDELDDSPAPPPVVWPTSGGA